MQTLTKFQMHPDSAKFTFNTDSPGVLACTAYAVTHPAHFKDSLVWSITPIEGSNLTTIPSPPRGDSVIYRFENLPSDNDEFGRKYIKASLVNYNARDSVMVKAFYNKTATNHSGGVTPNWYYYWSQSDAYVWGRQSFGGTGCNPNKAGYYDPGETPFHICDSGAVRCSSECAQTWWDGIDVFAASELHENTHLNDWWSFWPNGYDSLLDRDPPTLTDSTYGDYVRDSLEGTSQYPNFSPLAKDSDNDGHKDFDDLGYDFECNWICGTADSLDWASPGHQY